jgi:hypothetical protein
MPMIAQCGLEHRWSCDAQLITRKPARREDRRTVRAYKDWFVVPSRCPACGHSWTAIKPVENEHAQA